MRYPRFRHGRNQPQPIADYALDHVLPGKREPSWVAPSLQSPFLSDRSVRVLRHAGEVDCDLATLQHPTVGEAHLSGALIGGDLDGFYDHQRVGGFAPERDLD